MRLRTLALLVASGLLIAACGGGSDSAETTAVTSPATTAAPSATTPETQPVATDPPAAVTTQPAPADTRPPTTEPPAPSSVTVTSPDGNLIIRVDGADDERISPSVGILDPADWPPEVAGGANLPGVTLYDLQPSGATFEKPVLITRRLDAANIPDLGPFDLPVVTLLTYSDGEYELLDDLAVVRFGDDVYVSGTTTHFSGLLASSEGSGVGINEFLTLSGYLDASFVAEDLDPDAAALDLDDVELDFDFDFANGLRVPREQLGGISEAELALDDWYVPPEAAATISSDAVLLASLLDEDTGVGYGAATTTFELPISDAPSAAQLLGEAIDAEFDTFEYQAWIFLATVPDEYYDDALDLVDEMFADLEDDVEFIVDVFHELFGEYPSYTRRRYRGLPSIPPGLVGYSALFEGSVDNPRFVSVVPFEDDNGDWVAESGIECFCEYGEMMFFFDPDNAAELVRQLDDPAGYGPFWTFASSNTDVVYSVVVTDTATGAPKTYQVGPDEGLLLEDFAAFETVP